MADDAAFRCAECGTTHAGHPKDWAFSLPDVVWAIPEAERRDAAFFNTDLCRMGDRGFIRGYLALPFRWSDDVFGWGVWAEVDIATLDRYADVFDADATNEPPANGRLANRLRPNDDTTDEMLTIAFGTSTERPRFAPLRSSTTSLAHDYSVGLGPERYHEILTAMGVEPRLPGSQTRALTCSHVVSGEHPVLMVFHEIEGDWQFLCGADRHDDAEIAFAHLGHLVDRDATLNETLDLREGWDAGRTAVGAPWTREETGPVEE
jgi:hypothetical protein